MTEVEMVMAVRLVRENNGFLVDKKRSGEVVEMARSLREQKGMSVHGAWTETRKHFMTEHPSELPDQLLETGMNSLARGLELCFEPGAIERVQKSGKN